MSCTEQLSGKLHVLPAQSPFPEELRFSGCYELIGNKNLKAAMLERCGDSLKQLLEFFVLLKTNCVTLS